MGIIYRLISPSGKSYIGQTIRPFDDRFDQHVRDAEAAAKVNFEKKSCRALCRALMKHGPQNFKKEILLVCDDSMLDEFEERIIKLYGTLRPNGYNLKTGGKRPTFSQETKDLMKVNIPKGISKHIDSYREHKDELKGLPMGVAWYQKGEVRGYRLVRYGSKLKNKRFADKDTPLPELKAKMLEYLESLKTQERKSIQQIRKDQGIAKGIRLRTNGACEVNKVIKKKTYAAYFNDGDYEYNLACATNYVKILEFKFKGRSSETKWQSAIPGKVIERILEWLKI